MTTRETTRVTTADGPRTWTGHVVVCGLHDEGLRVVEQLHSAGVRTVAVDDAPDARLVRALERLDVPYLNADSRLPATLEAAGLAGASALVCVESEDPHTLATALLARQLRPDVRVVVQLRNAAVGRALTELEVAVLDVAGLAAPSIVEACLSTGRWTMRLGDHDFVVVEAPCTRDGSLRELYGDLAPVGVVPAAGGPVVVTPGRDLRVVAGDTVVVLGEPDAVARAGLEARRPARSHTREQSGVAGARGARPTGPRRNTLLRDVVVGLDRGFKVAVGLLVLLVAVSITVLTVGYREGDGTRMSPLDALYFTVETIGTVGYGDFYFRDQPSWLRLWAVALMVVGATLATVFFALLTNTLVSRRLEESLGKHRITGLDGHVVVVGAGSIGTVVTQQLIDAGVEAVCVEPDLENRFRGELRALRVPMVTADATLPDTWGAVQLDRARAVAVLTSDDMVNIETGLAVRDQLAGRWADVPVVLRIFDRQLATTVERTFGFHFVRSPAALAAPWFVGAALGLTVVDTFYVADQPMLVAELDVHDGDGLVGRAMSDLAARIRVVALDRRDGTTLRLPRREDRFAAGDRAFLVGPYEELLLLLRGTD